MDYAAVLSREFAAPLDKVSALIGLIDQGNTIPFIARYRKEATGSMDDQLIRRIGERLDYLRGLDKRRQTIRESISDQGALTPGLESQLAAAATLAELEDLYRPYKPKRKTRASAARVRGLEPLAARILLQERGDDPEALAAGYISAALDVPDTDSALEGARDIIAETVSDDARVRALARGFARREGRVVCRAAGEQDSVYHQYYDYAEPAQRMPDHRVLAVNRGEKEGFLKVSVELDAAAILPGLCAAYVRGGGACAEQVRLACEDAWKRLIEPAAARELRGELTERAQAAAVKVFQGNLRQLLMQPPLKGRVVLGVDPGFRTGCKLAVVDASGRVLETGVGHFTLPGLGARRAQAKAQLLSMIDRHGVSAVAIGNGTASREAESFVAELLRERPQAGYVLVSEAGASVYSASPLAAQELGAYDVSIRGAVSIARRLQDPLAELVKIDPKAIGVGQYQHDLKEAELTAALAGVVEDCVNQVGVELMSASPQLLEHVAGIGPALARAIVAYRDSEGITCREALKKVPKLGKKAYEQCAGFLRLAASDNPLDNTGVHPESYGAAKALLKRLGYKMEDLKRGGLPDLPDRAEKAGMETLARELAVGLPTLRDMVKDLAKPGRDPREALPPPVLRRDVLEIKDLRPGMELTGTVRNVIDFGAFVDIGVHQDGLVHISRLSDRFVRHPSEVVKVGDVVTVWVVEVDEKRGRIALSMAGP